MLLGFGESSASAAAIYGDETACGARNSVEREGGDGDRHGDDGRVCVAHSWRWEIVLTGGAWRQR